MSKKSVGDDIHLQQKKWRFSGDVPQNFSSHVRRSVPMYDESLELIAELAANHLRLKKTARIYDLGCSNGILTRRLATALNQLQSVDIKAIDLEPDMINEARQQSLDFVGINYLCADISDFILTSCQLITCCYTLQFVDIELRQSIIDGLFQALEPGGLLLFTEKISFAEPSTQQSMLNLYHQFKARQGYSQEEIDAKHDSLIDVLRPLTAEQNHTMLANSGFIDIHRFFQHSCFCGWQAYKPM